MIATGGAPVDPVQSDGSEFTAADFWRQAGVANVLSADIRADGGNSVLYHLSLGAWMRLFPVSPASIRGLSALAGCLTVLAVWNLGRRFLPARAVLVATVLATFHPLMVRYSQEARSYAFAGLLLVAATCVLLDLTRARKVSLAGWSGYGVLAGAAVLSHYLAATVLLAHGAWLLLHRVRHGGLLAAGLAGGGLVGAWMLTGGNDGLRVFAAINSHYARHAAAPGADAYLASASPVTVLAGLTQLSAAEAGLLLQRFGVRLGFIAPLLAVPLLLSAMGFHRVRDDADARRCWWLCASCALAAPLAGTGMAVISGHAVSFSPAYAMFSAPFAALLLGAAAAPGTPGARSAPGMLAPLILGAQGALQAAGLAAVYGDLPNPRGEDQYRATAYGLRQVSPTVDRVTYPTWGQARMVNLFLPKSCDLLQRVRPAGDALAHIWVEQGMSVTSIPLRPVTGDAPPELPRSRHAR